MARHRGKRASRGYARRGGDFPLAESGELNCPTQYAKALVINFKRWPAALGRGAGIFLPAA
ncbi:hypothetical protein ACIBUR_21855 [Streptomyces anulatus]